MQIPVTALLDQLYDLLAKTSHLVSLYAAKDSSFIPSLETWLTQAEMVLEKNRQPQLAEIAALRAQLLAASHAVYDKNAFIVPAIVGHRKIFNASAAVILSRAQSTLSGLHATFSIRKEEAEKYLRQMILISIQKDTFNHVWNSDVNISAKLMSLWQSFCADNDLVQGTRQVLLSVHYVDALRLLGETIDDLKL